MGSLLYNWLHFGGTFYFFGILLSLIFLCTILMIPSSLNKEVETTLDVLAKRSQHLAVDKRKSQLGASSIGRITFLETHNITYFRMLKNHRVRVAVVSGMVGVIFMFFYDSILTEHLGKIGVDEKDSGFFFGLISFVYILSSLLVGYLCRFIKRRYIT
jgi:hypothetical protein